MHPVAHRDGTVLLGAAGLPRPVRSVVWRRAADICDHGVRVVHLHGRRLRLECWDADFEEWCNVVVEEPEWLPNKSKLKAHLAA